MHRKKIQQWLLYRLVEAAFFVLNAALRLLPPRLFRRLCEPALSLLVYFLVPRKRIVKNLSAAFGRSYSAPTKEGIAHGVQENFTRSLIDCFLQLKDPERARRKVTIDGLENLTAALAKGKGVIALGAHIGNFVLVGTRLGMEGYSVSTLFRMPPDSRLKTIIERYLPFFYQQVIPSRPRRVAIRRIAEALKRNEIIFILGDNLKKGKVETSLFGQRVHTPRGPVSLALRSGAALVPMYLVRTYGGRLRLVIEPEMLLIKHGNVYEDVTGNTREIVRYLEGLIGRYPDQWNWLTVRMKRTRPRRHHGSTDTLNE
jgi:Kdo2-lipid IVA lauroyltransferase/acyltransferase